MSLHVVLKVWYRVLFRVTGFLKRSIRDLSYLHPGYHLKKMVLMVLLKVSVVIASEVRLQLLVFCYPVLYIMK